MQTFEEWGRTFEQGGLQVGDRVEGGAIATLDGETVELGSLWERKPMVLVTASLTCPIARARIGGLQRIARELGDGINAVVLYTVDAHPKIDHAPHRPGEEWLTPDNEREGILHRQPTTLAERRELAQLFRADYAPELPVYLDDLDNTRWQQLGTGACLGLLVRMGGQVALKQGWFEADTMLEAARRELSQTGWP